MKRITFLKTEGRICTLSKSVVKGLLIFSLIVLNIGFNVLSNISFKKSSLHYDFWGFLKWQIPANFSGLFAVIALTFLMRYVPLRVAIAIQFGLAFVFIQVISASLVFKEKITIYQWFGVVIVFLGILLISFGKQNT